MELFIDRATTPAAAARAAAQEPVLNASKAELDAARAAGMYAQAPAFAATRVLAALGIAVLLASHMPMQWLSAWLLIQFALGGAAIALLRAYHGDATSALRPGRWSGMLTGLGVLAAVSWSPVPAALMHFPAAGAGVAAALVIAAVPLWAVFAQRHSNFGMLAATLGFLAPCATLFLLLPSVPYGREAALACAGWGAIAGLAGTRLRRMGDELLIARASQGRLLDELHRTRELADLGARTQTDFLGNMGHHLRTPLTVVLGMAKLLKLMELDREQKEAVEMIDRSGEDLLAHINQLLEAAQLEYGQVKLTKTEFDLHRLLEEVGKRTAEAAAAKGLRFELQTTDKMPRLVLGDEGRLRDVLWNLCDNAVKFTPAGQVVLAVSSERLWTAPDQADLRFSVTDTGIGMDSATLSRAFDPFFQADATATRHFRGAGLGLTIAQRLAHLMGSPITARSTPGRGSTFSFAVTFEIPRKQHRSDPPAAPDAGAMPGPVPAAERERGAATPSGDASRRAYVMGLLVSESGDAQRSRSANAGERNLGAPGEIELFAPQPKR